MDPADTSWETLFNWQMSFGERVCKGCSQHAEANFLLSGINASTFMDWFLMHTKDFMLVFYRLWILPISFYIRAVYNSVCFAPYAQNFHKICCWHHVLFIFIFSIVRIQSGCIGKYLCFSCSIFLLFFA